VGSFGEGYRFKSADTVTSGIASDIQKMALNEALLLQEFQVMSELGAVAGIDFSG
jgi:hypothetical protein